MTRKECHAACTRILQKLKIDDHADKAIIKEKMVLINIKRLFYVAIIAMPLSLIEITIFFMNSSSGDATEHLWRISIILAQFTLFISMAILGSLAYFSRNKRTPNRLMWALQYVAVLVILIAGAVIVAIDQMVVPSITPYVIVCTIIGAIFLISPLYAAIIHTLSYITFYFAISITQQNPDLLLSNRVNGLFSYGIGICLSYILWRTNSVNLQQAEFIKKQQNELKEKNKQLEQLAFFDPLTGLFNRRYFEEQLRNEIARMQRYENESCVAIMDIDYFKNINDSYGHPTGDRLLKIIALILNRHLRATDILSRWGGEEFIILLPNTSLHTGKLVTEKIRRIIENEIFIIDEQIIHITVSFGVSMLSTEMKDTFEYSYVNADKALYNAKQNGRNRVETA